MEEHLVHKSCKKCGRVHWDVKEEEQKCSFCSGEMQVIGIKKECEKKDWEHL